jgi:hypothetical protein
MAPPGRLAAPQSLAAQNTVDNGSPAGLAMQLRQESARWQQATDGGPSRPADEVLVGWLNLLAQAVDTPTDTGALEAALAPGAPRVLLLLRDGQWAHRFVLDGHGLRWERPAQASRTLLLSPQVLRRLEARWPAERP